MKVQVISVLLLIIICSVSESSGAAEFVSPPSGSVIANFEGPDNATFVTCNITDQGVQISTQWSIENRRDNPAIQTAPTDLFEISGDLRPNSTTITFFNRISILNFTSDLDNSTLYCGTGAERRQANFTIRLYRPPNLRDNFLVLLEEGVSQDIPVDLREQPSGFPEPTAFNWTRDGQPFTARPLTFSSVTFDTVNRADTGNYVVTATNFAFGVPAVQIGSDTGSFTLNVLYGPSFQSDGPQLTPTQVYVLLGNPLSLVCGRGLESNPNATVAWTGSDGTPILDTPRYDLENGPQIVRLNFTTTIMSDNGMWLCEVEVISQRHVLDGNNNLVLVQPELIGARLRHQFQLTIISPPGQPRTVSMENIGATWVQISWEPPLTVEFPISFYEIIARASDDLGEIINMSTPDNSTFVNVTNLLPGTTYNFTVVAVIQGGDVITRGPESLPLQGVMTEFTVPEIVCPMPESRNGNITASWTYVHTGGLPLTGVSVTYTYEEGTSTVSNSVNVGTSDMRLSVPGLVTGREYTFTVTAQNANGSNSTVCAPVDHIIGVPAPPQFGDLITGPNPGVITIQIKTVASGVNSPSQNFRFNITPVLAGIRQTGRTFDFPTYMSGEFVSIAVDQLQTGESYTFSATAMNTFGNSMSANSPAQFAGGDSLPPPPSSNPPPVPGDTSNSAAIAAGVAVPVIILAIVVVIVVLLILFIFLRRNKDQGNYKVEGGKYHKASTSEPGVRVYEEGPGVDVGTALEKAPKDTEHEIQYAELDTFRPPSQQKNNTNEAKPVQPEEPVEYAVITTFKKKDEAPAAADSSAVPDPTPEAADANNDADKAGTSTTLV